MTDHLSKPLTSKARIEGIDQTRGYAILGMIVVNYASIFTVFPEWLKHHKTGMTYADTIAPLFIFVVGMTFRLSFQRRSREGGLSAARSAAVERNLKLLGIGLLYGHFDLEVSVWDALTDIALASLIALPVIHRSSLTRLITAVLLLAAYQVIFMTTGYGEWVMAHTINGGPLGPLSWAFPLLAGTIAMDWIEEIRATGSMRRPLIKMAAAGFLLMAAGQLLSLEWPGVKTAWPHTQYGMTAPYPIFSSGLSLLTVAAFILLCDGIHFRLPHLTTFGSNPLVLYLMQAGLNQIASDWLDSDLTLVPALTGMAAVYFACYCTAWILRRKGIYIKL